MHLREYVCLDLGPERIAGVEVEHGGIENAFTLAPTPGSMSGGAPADPTGLARQLRAALDQAGIKARAVRVAVPDTAMLTLVLDLPVPRWHLRRALAFAVERAIPIPKAQLAWTWTWEPGEDGRRTVCVVASWRDVVDRVWQTMVAAGLRPEVIKPRSAALRSLFGRSPTLLLEQVGRTVQATAVAPGRNPFTAQAPVPLDDAGWPGTLESLVTSTRRHLGAAGRDLRLFVSRDLADFVPEALWARPAAEAIDGRRPRPRAGSAADAYLAAIGLTVKGGRLPALRSTGGPSQSRLLALPQLTGQSWVPALAAVTIVSWSAVAAGIALLLGWHPSWPLAP